MTDLPFLSVMYALQALMKNGLYDEANSLIDKLIDAAKKYGNDDEES